MTVIIGGSASGKSGYAEDFVKKQPQPRFYIATMQPFDQECVQRIIKHKEQRKTKGFQTMESYVDVGKVQTDKAGTVLLECMSNLVANELYRPEKNDISVVAKILSDIRILETTCKHLVIVTNDVFHDGCVYPEETMEYLRVLGEINRELCGGATTVVEVVCGIPIYIKGGNI